MDMNRILREVVISWVIIFLSWLLVPSMAYALESQTSQGQHILWKVQSKTNALYVLGSIHVLQEKHYPLDPKIYSAFAQCQSVMFEVDLGSLADPQIQMQMLAKGLFMDGQTLQGALSPTNYQKAKRAFSELGLHIDQFQQMEPWMAAISVTALKIQELGFESAYGIDQHFYDRAKKTGKSISGLETVDFQLNLFDRLSPEMQELFLLQSLDDLQDIEAQVQDMVKAWMEGNLQALEPLVNGMQEYPELYQALVVDRNNDWLLDLEAALEQSEPVCVVVGALHLVGKDGLIADLQEKGYVVERF